MAGSRSRKLRDDLQKAILKERYSDALRIYSTLELVEPREPRWPHRKGDLLNRLGRKDAAADSYEAAVDLYAEAGFVARAAAMAKVVLGIDATRTEVLDRLNVDQARKLHRSARGTFVTATLGEGNEPTSTKTKRIALDALPLVRDDSVADGELRFTKPPKSNKTPVELDVSAVEVEARTGIRRGALSERPTALHLALLPATPLLAEVPKPVLSRLVRESRLIDLEDGERLIEKGTTADALFTLVEGSVRLRRGADDQDVILAEGDVLGISCLLDEASYGADVVAHGPMRALRISKVLLDRLVKEHPPLGEVLFEMAGRRLVATLVRTSPLFGGFDDEGRSRVARMFEVRKATKGTLVLEAGKRSDGLYIPMLGDLLARDADGVELGSLKLGRVLGQHSVMTQAASPLTVEASTDVLVLRMPATRFNQLVAKHPKMIAHLEALARRPSAPTYSLVPAPQKKEA
ncbi:MAG: cyclic nucleotide-binding domain-containing protein [Myxococcota bacterium]